MDFLGNDASNKGRENKVYPAAEIKKICLNAQADDVGLVDLDRDALQNMAVCPEGEEVKPIFLENRKEHVERILKPLRDRQERVYVTAGSKAESTARKNPHEEVRD